MVLSRQALHHLQKIADLPDLHDSKYKVIEKVASGGMGTVYLVEDNELKRRVALKVINVTDATGELAVRMLREAQIIAGLEHPGIVPVHDVGRLPDGRTYYTMKFVQGSNLAQFAQRSASLSERLRVFQRVCEAIAFAHARQVIHRDLKPENIMIGDFGEALIMDWGIAKLITDPGGTAAQHSTSPTDLDRAAGISPNGHQDTVQSKARAPGSPQKVSPGDTASGAILGTPGYMAPEQSRGHSDLIDHRSDIYALGAILVFLIYGTPKPDKSVSATGGRPRIPKPLKSVVAQAMAGSPSDRYQDARELAGDIDRYLGGLKVSAHTENVFEALWRWIKKNKFITILVLTYLVMRLLIFILRGL